MAIDVIIADDHMMFRQGLIAVLKSDPEVEIVGEAETGSEAVDMCEELGPDIAVVDITMPEMNGFIAARLILDSCPGTRVLMLSMHLNEAYILESLRSGAMGYVLKDSACEELLKAIKAVYAGDTYLSPKATTILTRGLVAEERVKKESIFDMLTTREQQILQLIVEGNTTRRTAEILDLSPKTVENHRANIMRKLNIHDVPTLVRFAIRSGLVEA